MVAGDQNRLPLVGPDEATVSSGIGEGELRWEGAAALATRRHAVLPLLCVCVRVWSASRDGEETMSLNRKPETRASERAVEAASGGKAG